MSNEERRLPLAAKYATAPPASDADTTRATADKVEGVDHAVDEAAIAAESTPAVSAAEPGDPLAVGMAVMVIAALLLCAGLVLIAAG